MEKVVPHGWRIENGYLLTTDYPRLGIAPDEAAALCQPPQGPGEPPHWRCPDGLTNDW